MWPAAGFVSALVSQQLNIFPGTVVRGREFPERRPAMTGSAGAFFIRR
jgi:hypothetical protein